MAIEVTPPNRARTAGIGLHRMYGFELEQAGIPLLRQGGIPVPYKGMQIPVAFSADLLVAEAIILAIKAFPALLPAHQAQLLTYPRMSGLLMNVQAARPA